MSDLLNQASLVMIPSGYKEDTVYSVVPSDGSGDLSFTRASNGTRVNSAGLVEVVPWNLLTYSEQFDNAAWSLASATIGANATTAPNGTTTAESFTSLATNANHVAYQLLSYTGGSYTYSVYVKKANSRYVYIKLVGDASQWVAAVFDLNDGTLTKSEATGWTGLTASSESVGNGWYRLIVSGSGATSVNFNVGIQYTNTGTPTFSAYADASFTGTGTIDYYIWGAQLNIGSTAKPYFPTTDRLNVPRLTYQNGGGGCPSLLLEKQSTNLFSYSNGEAGMAFNGTLTLNNTTSPEGVSNAFSFLVNANANGGLAIQTITTSAQSYTFSAYLKGSVNGQKVRLFGDLNSTIEDFTLTTDWVRYTKTFTGAVGVQSIYLLNGAFMSPAQNNLYYGYGMQLEVSSYATSLIPSNGASATRVADACFKTGISSLIGTDFTLFYDGYETIGGQSTRYVVLKGSGGIYANAVFLEGSSNNTIALTVLNSSSAAIFTGFSPSLTNGQRVKLAVRCKNNDFAYYVNGSLVNSQASGSVPTTSDLYLGYYVDYTDNYSAVNQLAIFNTALTNAELASLTTI